MVIRYAVKNGLRKHPDFKWVNQYLDKDGNTLIKVLQAKGHQGMKFKFGVQIPTNLGHAFHLDKINNNQLWEEAIKKEMDSLNDFKTFRALELDEPLPSGYSRIPYHLIYDCKFNQRRKYRLVLGGHCTPEVSPNEVYSGVVSMEQ